MKRWLLISLVALAGLLLLAGSGVAWLLHTESGARWLVQRAGKALPALQVSVAGGNLGDGLQLRSLRYHQSGFRVSAEQALLAVDMDWLPVALNITRLEATSPRIILEETTEPAPETDDAPLDLTSPIPVRLRQVLITDLVASMAPDTTLLTLDRIRGEADLSDTLELEALRLRGQDFELELDGHLLGVAPFTHQLQASVRLGPDNPWLALPLDEQLGFTAEGDLGTTEIRLLLDGAVAGDLQVSVRDLGEANHWQLGGQIGPLGLPLGSDRPDLQAGQLTLQASGDLQNYQLLLQGPVTAEPLGEAALAVNLLGDLEQLRIDPLTLAGDAVALKLDGQLELASLAANGRLQLDRLDLTRLLQSAEPLPEAHGQLSFLVDGEQLQLPDLRLALEGLPTVIEGSALLTPDAVQADLEWRSLNWPPGSQPLVQSPTGTIKLSGLPEDWQLQASAALLDSADRQGQITLNANGDQEHAVLQRFEGSALDGHFSGSGEVRWLPQTEWQLQLVSERFNPALLVAWMPGAVSADLEASGTDSAFSANIHRLDGTLTGQSLSGSGAIRADQQRWSVDDLKLGLGSTTFSADGDWPGAEGLDWQLEAGNLGQFSPDWSGALQAQGQLRDHQERFSWELALTGSNLNVNGLGSQQLKLESSGSGREWITGTTTVNASGVDAAGLVADQLDTVIQLAEDRAELRLDATLPQMQLGTTLSGQAIPMNLELDSWQGSLDRLQLNREDNPGIALSKPAPLMLSPELVQLGNACMARPDRPDILCAIVDWRVDAQRTVTVSLDQMPVRLLANLANLPVRLNQQLTGQLTWTGAAGQAPNAAANLEISPGRVSLGPGQAVRTGTGTLEFNYRDGALLSGLFDITLDERWPVHADWQVENLALGLASPVTGSATVRIDDLSFVHGLLPELDEVAGRLNADLGIAGTLGEPLISGTTQLENGRLHYAPMGAAVSGINTMLALSETGVMDIDGQFGAGDGSGSIAGQLQFEGFSATSGDIRVSGDNLQLMDLPDRFLAISPDLDVAWQPERVDLNGSIAIDRALLAPAPPEAAPVTLSEDTVILGQQEEEDTAEPPLEVHGQVELAMGENFEFAAGGASARVLGDLSLLWQGDVTPFARGMLTMDGQFQAYGQNLEISQAEIRYPDNTLVVNPSFDIRATREIFGDTEVDYAGVAVTGNARRPKVTLYTDPPTNEEKALAYVLTGSNFDHGSGVGALNIGTYILPRLFVSYGIGLFDNGNVINARYDLSEQWGVKAESGERDTGVDLIWSVQK